MCVQDQDLKENRNDLKEIWLHIDKNVDYSTTAMESYFFRMPALLLAIITLGHCEMDC